MSDLSEVRAVYEHIRRKLANADLPPEGRLSENGIAREMGVTRFPVRIAIGQLVAEGFLVQIPKRGTFVRPIDRIDNAEAYELRQLLEVGAISRAASLLTDEQLNSLRDNVREMRPLIVVLRSPSEAARHAEAFRRWCTLDMLFHVTFVRAGANRRLLKIVTDILVHTRAFEYSETLPVNLNRALVASYREHYRIYRALAARDPVRARRVLSDHLRKARERTVELFDIQDRQRAIDEIPVIDIDTIARLDQS